MSDAQSIASALAARAADVARHLLPRGRQAGSEFKVGSIAGEPGESLSVHVGRGAKAGVWQDFATGEGGDLLDLWAAVRCNGNRAAAMRDASDYLGMSRDRPRPPPRRAPPRPVAAAGEDQQAIPEYADPPDWRRLAGRSLDGYLPTGRWTYQDADGNDILLHWRFDRPGARKEFRPFRWGGDGWVSRWPDRRPLYRLPELAASSGPVLVVEGEKTADRAAHIASGYAVTTWPAGAKAAAKVDWSPLAGRHVVIWPDADGPGLQAAGDIARRLAAIGAASVAIVELPADLPEGWDLADDLPAGWHPGKIAELIAAAPVCGPPAPEGDDSLDRTPRLDLAGDFDQPPPPLVWHVEDLLPAAHVALMVGEGGSGKSLLAMQLATATAMGSTFLGRQVRQGRTLAIYCEDDADTLRRRQHDINRGYRATVPDLRQLDVYARLGADNFLMTFDGVLGEPTAFYGELERLLEDRRPALLILDNLAHLFAGNENDRVSVQQFLNRLTGIAQQYRTTVVLLSHPSKQHNVSGSTGWEAHVRSVLTLEYPKAEEVHHQSRNDQRILKLAKSNYVKRGTELKLRYDGGIFVLVEDSRAPGFAGYLDEVAKLGKAAEVFLDALTFLVGKGLTVSSSPKAGDRYAPAMMLQRAPMVRTAGLSKHDLTAAMNHLFEAGRLEEVWDGPPSNGRRKLAAAAPPPGHSPPHKKP